MRGLPSSPRVAATLATDMQRTLLLFLVAAPLACARTTSGAAATNIKQPEPATTTLAPARPNASAPAWTFIALPHPAPEAFFVAPELRNGSLGAPIVQAEAAASFRYERRDQTVAVAHQFPAVPFVSTSGTDTHLFVAGDGSIFRADSMTGDLTLITAAPRSLAATLWGDTVMGLAEDGRVWTLAPGANTIEVVREHARTLVGHQGSVFVLDDDGSLHRLDPGAKAFAPELQGKCVSAIASTNRRPIATVDGTPQVIPATASSTAMRPSMREILDAYAPLLRWGTMTRLTDGRMVAIDRRQLWDLGDPGNAQPIARVDPSCTLATHGEQVFRRCPTDDNDRVRLSVLNGHAWTELPVSFAHATLRHGHTWLVGSDREHWYRSDGQLTERLPADGKAPEFRWFSAQRVIGSWHVFSSDGQPWARDLSDPDNVVPVTIQIDDHVRTAADILYRFERTEGVPRAALGSVRTGLKPMAVPATTRAMAMVDARRGLAVGADASQVWITTDGGEHWTQPTLPIVGDAAAVDLPPTVTCTNASCRVGALVWGDFSPLDHRPTPTQIIGPAQRTRRASPPYVGPCGPAKPPPTTTAKRALPGAATAIQCPSRGHCTIDRNWFASQDNDALIRQARIVPSQRGGTIHGLKLYGIRRGSVPKLLRFRNGDLVTRVDDLALFEAAAWDTVWQRFADGGTFRVEFTRKGEEYQRLIVIE